MKPVVKLVMFVKKLYQNGLPNFQVPALNGTWLEGGEESLAVLLQAGFAVLP
jgi:hypothetical protein